IQRFELLEGVTKLGRFVRSTGGIRLGIKIKNHIFPVKILQRNGRAAVVNTVEVRCLVAFFEHEVPSAPRGLG
ncbi:MAG: hypothetical protein WA193_09265, partial [Candidatus Acidiferrales bacterium]